MASEVILGPQPGPQSEFLSSSADIVIYGGSAGGGKTYGLLLEPLRYLTNNPHFSSVIFRRNAVQVKNPGGLWDTSMSIYPMTAGVPTAHVMEWEWKKGKKKIGGKLKFAHLENENSVLDWQGSAITMIGFDELTHFTASQFWYLLSRNRVSHADCKVKPYIRATTNPEAGSWVEGLISWWIDQTTGLPIPERSGVIRWFIRLSDIIIWGDSEQELIDNNPGVDVRPKSLTFIPSTLDDNQALMKADPGYKASLMALTRVEKERLLGGNWKVRPQSGMYFRKHEATIIDVMPTDLIKTVRSWDLAATEEGEGKDPDWTVGILMGLRQNGRYVVLDLIRERKRSGDVKTMVKRTAGNDTIGVTIRMAQDPGSAGKAQVEDYIKELAGYVVVTERETGDKVKRAEPFSSQWQHGNVDVLRGPWNDQLFQELEVFPSKAHDDIPDACSGAFKELSADNLVVWAKMGSMR